MMLTVTTTEHRGGREPTAWLERWDAALRSGLARAAAKLMLRTLNHRYCLI